MNNILGLGRLVEFDDRSRSFPIRSLIEPARPRSYTWSCSTYLNQGSEGACVGFSIAHEINARPIPRRISQFLARLIYKEAQKVDYWAGESYEGTSVLAGFKIATEMGFYDEYRWAFGLEDVLLALSYKGPVILGINWYESMFSPDVNGKIVVSGNVSGGHAILATGHNISSELVRLHNSWGTNWGKGGDAFISYSDLRRLLNEDGEACVPVTRK